MLVASSCFVDGAILAVSYHLDFFASQFMPKKMLPYLVHCNTLYWHEQKYQHVPLLHIDRDSMHFCCSN